MDGASTHGTEEPLERERADEPAGRPQSERQLRAWQREEFGGFSRGSIFFGWLAAVGLAAILTAMLSGAGAAIGITDLNDDNAEAVGIVGGVLLVAVLAVSYYSGGYVAGRLARFDGARQGLGVWLLGLLVTLAFAAFAAIAGAEWNVFERLDLPRIPVEEGTLTTGGAITLVAVAVGTLVAAVAGGKIGERFHHRVDRIAFERSATR